MSDKKVQNSKRKIERMQLVSATSLREKNKVKRVSLDIADHAGFVLPL